MIAITKPAAYTGRRVTSKQTARETWLQSCGPRAALGPLRPHRPLAASESRSSARCDPHASPGALPRPRPLRCSEIAPLSHPQAWLLIGPLLALVTPTAAPGAAAARPTILGEITEQIVRGDTVLTPRLSSTMRGKLVAVEAFFTERHPQQQHLVRPLLDVQPRPAERAERRGAKRPRLDRPLLPDDEARREVCRQAPQDDAA